MGIAGCGRVGQPTMKTHTSVAIVFLTFAPLLLAHGGQYRGPGEVIPPSNRTSQSSTPGNTQTAGSPSAPTPGATAGSGPKVGATGPGATASAGVNSGGPIARGAPLDDDLTRWEFWWEFGKDPYLSLRTMVHAVRTEAAADDTLLNPRLAHRARDRQQPTSDDLDGLAVFLVGVLKSAKDRDTVSASLIALAKIGRSGAAFDLREELLPFLAGNDQELRETAALALGISGILTRANVDSLLALVADSPTGRKLSEHTAVQERTRAFAAFGLGLLLHRSRDLVLSHDMVEGLLPILRNPAAFGRDLKVAAVEALAQFPADWTTPGAIILRRGVIDELGAYYDKKLGPGEQLMQAHVPVAIARLTGGDDRRAVWKQRFAADLLASLDPSGDSNRDSHSIAQSCALALGGMCERWDDATSADVGPCQLLVRSSREHKDQQVRSFARIALGQIGGTRATEVLVHDFEGAGKALEQPWDCLALAVLVARERSVMRAAGGSYTVSPAIVEPLRSAFAEARNPSALGALAVALGLCQDKDSAEELRNTLRTHSKRDDIAGYVGLGLGLLQDDLAVGDLRAALRGAERRPQVLMQCSRALGLLGDITVVEDLGKLLESPEVGLTRLSAAAAALGQIGDRRSLPVLKRMATNPELTALGRAFAVVALGGVGDKDPLPWNTAYATMTNYRAATETLTDGSSGILDIL